jgi:hypothetical protein
VLCIPRNDWTAYTLQPGDTLDSLARALNLPIGAILRANCLQSLNGVSAGSIILLPYLPSADILPQGCTALGSQITNLASGQIVGGVFTIQGTATSRDFAYYRLEIRPDKSDFYTEYSRSTSPVEGGDLGQIDTTIFPEKGRYWIRLTVVDRDGSFAPPCAIPTIFQ